MRATQSSHVQHSPIRAGQYLVVEEWRPNLHSTCLVVMLSMTLISRMSTAVSTPTSIQFPHNSPGQSSARRLITAMVLRRVLTGAWSWTGLKPMGTVEVQPQFTPSKVLGVTVAQIGVAERVSITATQNST